MMQSSAYMLDMAWRYRRILAATTRVELKKRFAGAMLGIFWAVLTPLLFLAIYLFLMTVVFRIEMPGLSSLGVIAFIFAGLVPFLAIMEAAGVGAVCIKQNMHLIKNVIVPIDLVPVRVVIMSLVGALAGFTMTFVILLIDGTLSTYAVLFPAVLLLQLLFMVGLIWFLAALGVLVPDLGFVINTLMVALMFISPIGFKATSVPPALELITVLNPIHYMIDSYRSVLMAGFGPNWTNVAVFAAISVGFFVLGAAFFRRFKSVLVDYE